MKKELKELIKSMKAANKRRLETMRDPKTGEYALSMLSHQHSTNENTIIRLETILKNST